MVKIFDSEIHIQSIGDITRSYLKISTVSSQNLRIIAFVQSENTQGMLKRLNLS